MSFALVERRQDRGEFLEVKHVPTETVSGIREIMCLITKALKETM